MILLDLSSEPMAKSGELDEESIQEFEPEERTDDFPETIESQTKRYTDEKVLKDYSPQVGQTFWNNLTLLVKQAIGYLLNANLLHSALQNENPGFGGISSTVENLFLGIIFLAFRGQGYSSNSS